MSANKLLATSPTEPRREASLAVPLDVEASLAFNESVSLRMIGPLHLESLNRALQALVARHEVLRATFSGDGLTLCIRDSATVAVSFFDSSSEESSTERDAAWQRLLTQAVEEPFDLERGPLVRASVLRLGPTEHRATFTTHHIVCDTSSNAALLREWSVLYSAFAREVPVDLPPVEPFSAYAQAHAEHLASPEHATDQSYWVTRFSGDIPVLDLPTDRRRPVLKTYRWRRENLTLDAALVARLNQTAAKETASLFAMLLAGFKTLLHRLTSQEDLVVGIPAAGQSIGGNAGLVGQCVHLLPLRSRVHGATPYNELLATLGSSIRDTAEHQRFAFAHPLEHLPLDRDQSRLPLVSVGFNLGDGIGKDDWRFEGLDVEVSTNPRQFENVDLFLNAVELDGQVVLDCGYNADLFDAATVSQWLQGYRTLLEGVIENPRCEIDGLPIVPSGDLQSLASWNQTSAEYPQVCVHQLIEAQVQRTPEAAALEFGGVTIRYAELNGRANQVARRLRAAGVAKGSLVGLCVERSIEMVVALLGVLKAGGAYVPLDPDYPLERLAFMVRDSGMPVLLTERKLRDSLLLPVAQVLCLDDAEMSQQDEQNLPADSSSADPESLAYVIYTSGSTGQPKGVLVPHRAVVNLLTSVRSKPGMNASDVVLAITTLSFDIAVSELLLPLSVGARIVLATRDVASDGMQLLRTIREARVTFVDATPSTWRLLIEAGWDRGDGGEHLKAICTGEAMPKDLAADLIERADSVWNGYGPTETTVWSTFHEIKQPVERILIGKPVANTRIYILDENMRPVPVGVSGELYIGGAGVTDGYLNRPELTAARFVSDPFDSSPTRRLYRTGDIARYLRSGDLECLGRNDDQVKLRGFRIELGEIEAALGGHEAVGRAAVVAREDRPGDMRLIAYFVPRANRSATEAELRAHLRTMLPSHMIPAAFIPLDAMPLTPSGKLNRRDLPAPATPGVALREGFVAPRTPTEALVASLWQEALGMERVSVHDDFFALGGHSLLASQVLARLRRDHGVELLFRALFEAPTVALFAKLVDGQARSTPDTVRAIVRRSDDRPTRLSVMQERIWLLETMDPHQRVVHNLSAAWRIAGPLDPNILESSLNEIVARHEILRTCVRVRDGVPFQEVTPALTVVLGRLDLRDRPDTEREAAMMAFFDGETRRPHDLAIAPLFRATLVRLDEQQHVLFILPHSLIWDGWSFEIFLRELSTLYAAFADGRQSPLAQVPISYGDFARWQREWLDGAGSQQQREWWRTQLAGELPVVEIPSDRGRPDERTRAGANVVMRLPHEQVDALAAISRGAGGTLFTILFAAFSVLLHRLTGQDELVVGSPVRARTWPETEDLIGSFANMLVLRTRMQPDLTFVEFLARVRDVTLDSLSHQELPLEVVDIRAPILSAFFSLEDARSQPVGFGDLQLRSLHLLAPGSAADLMLSMMETQSGLRATLNYSSELFDAATMHRFLGRYRTLVADIARNPDRKVGELELIPEDETALLRELGETSPLEDRPVCLHELFEQCAERTPRAVALVAGNESVDYGELERRASRLAGELRARGVGTRVRVGVHLERSIELVTALLAIMKAGATWVTLDPADPPSRLGAILEDAGVGLVLTNERLRLSLPSGSASIVCVDAAATAALEGGALSPTSVPIDEPACLLYASDGEGRLSGASLTHRQLVIATGALTHALCLTEHDVALAVSPPSLDVSVLELFAPLAVGGQIVVAEADVTLDPKRLANKAADSAATVMIAPTALWRDLLASGPRSWTALRAVCVGDPPAGELAAELVSRTAGAWVAHGCPEAGIWSTLLQLGGSDPNGLLGRPLPGTRVRILDRHSREVPLGVVGELCVGTSSYRSGELARWRSDGMLTLVKRREGEVDVSGFRVDLKQIAVALQRHHAVQDAAVLLRAHGAGQKRLVGYVVPKAGRSYTDTELRRELRRTLPERMIPRSFIELDAIPRKADGRLDLENGGLLHPASEEDHVPPQTTKEILLARLWKDALGLQRVGVHDNFFALGGYSLLCFQVLERIERETGRRISPRLLLLDSLQQIAARLEETAKPEVEPGTRSSAVAGPLG